MGHSRLLLGSRSELWPHSWYPCTCPHARYTHGCLSCCWAILGNARLERCMLGKAKVLSPTGHWGRAAFNSCRSASRCFCVGAWKRPSAVRHSSVAPHKSTREPSCSTLLSLSTWTEKQEGHRQATLKFYVKWNDMKPYTQVKRISYEGHSKGLCTFLFRLEHAANNPDPICKNIHCPGAKGI